MAIGPYTLAELARAVGMNIADVQLYRERGLLQPARRRRGRSADVAFHEEHVERLRFIQRALAYGFPLEAITRMVDQDTLLTCGDVYGMTVKRLEELRAAGEVDTAAALALEQLASGCSRKGGRLDCSILATLNNGAGVSGKQASGK